MPEKGAEIHRQRTSVENDSFPLQPTNFKSISLKNLKNYFKCLLQCVWGGGEGSVTVDQHVVLQQ